MDFRSMTAVSQLASQLADGRTFFQWSPSSCAGQASPPRPLSPLTGVSSLVSPAGLARPT